MSPFGAASFWKGWLVGRLVPINLQLDRAPASLKPDVFGVGPMQTNEDRDDDRNNANEDHCGRDKHSGLQKTRQSKGLLVPSGYTTESRCRLPDAQVSPGGGIDTAGKSVNAITCERYKAYQRRRAFTRDQGMDDQAVKRMSQTSEMRFDSSRPRYRRSRSVKTPKPRRAFI
jgi:hypothetical protein